MPPIRKGSIVAVTGAGGYLGGWIVRLLLDRGYHVRACTRNASSERNKFLREMSGFSTGQLTIHSCDMSHEGAFAEVFCGCHAVVHTAADPDVPVDQRPEEYHKNSLLVTKSIADSGTVTRVIYTSSLAAIAGDTDIREYRLRPIIDERRSPNLENPLAVNGYVLGKLKSESVFFEAAKASGGRWDVIITNPSDIIGPILSKSHLPERKAWTPWHCKIARIIQGQEFPQSFEYRPWWTVDVRDTAEVHVRLLESPDAVFQPDSCHDNRYLICSTAAITVEEIGPTISRLMPDAGLAIDESAVPADVFGPAYLAQVIATEAEVRQIWTGCKLQNQKICKAVDMVFRPIEDSLCDCVESLLAVAGIEPTKGNQPIVKRPCIAVT